MGPKDGATKMLPLKVALRFFLASWLVGGVWWYVKGCCLRTVGYPAQDATNCKGVSKVCSKCVFKWCSKGVSEECSKCVSNGVSKDYNLLKGCCKGVPKVCSKGVSKGYNLLKGGCKGVPKACSKGVSNGVSKGYLKVFLKCVVKVFLKGLAKHALRFWTPKNTRYDFFSRVALGGISDLRRRYENFALRKFCFTVV